MKKLLQCLAVSFALFSLSAYAAGPTEVVYHIDDAESQGIKGLRNIRNHLDVSPQTKIIVVTHANGVDIMMEGAKDKKNGIEYAPLVKNRNLKKDQFILDTDFTPSGVVRVADLQYQNHFAYIKP
jgi:uncharacterized protein